MRGVCENVRGLTSVANPQNEPRESWRSVLRIARAETRHRRRFRRSVHNTRGSYRFVRSRPLAVGASMTVRQRFRGRFTDKRADSSTARALPPSWGCISPDLVISLWRCSRPAFCPPRRSPSQNLQNQARRRYASRKWIRRSAVPPICPRYRVSLFGIGVERETQFVSGSRRKARDGLGITAGSRRCRLKYRRRRWQAQPPIRMCWGCRSMR
jgi:hypothetical protein